MPFRQRDYLNPINPVPNNVLADFNRGFSSNNLSMGQTKQEKECNKEAFSNVNQIDDLKKLIKNTMIDDDSFAEFCINFLHQGGVPYALEAAIKKEANRNDTVPLGDDLASQRSFVIDKEQLVIEETVSIKNLRRKEDPESLLFRNEKNELLLQAKAKYVISKNSNKYEAQATDVIFDYRRPQMKDYLDKRNVFTKIKDWFKSVFKLNTEKDISTVHREPNFLFVTTEKENQSVVSQYAGKTEIFSK